MEMSSKKRYGTRSVCFLLSAQMQYREWVMLTKQILRGVSGRGVVLLRMSSHVAVAADPPRPQWYGRRKWSRELNFRPWGLNVLVYLSSPLQGQQFLMYFITFWQCSIPSHKEMALTGRGLTAYLRNTTMNRRLTVINVLVHHIHRRTNCMINSHAALVPPGKFAELTHVDIVLI